MVYLDDLESRVLAEYDKRRENFVAMGPVVEGLVSQFLTANDLNPHVVTHRVKSRQSLRKKLSRSGTKYTTLADITDVLGVRVITFFPDEVDRAADLLTPQFTVDEQNSVDKRASLDPDRFGYLSVHYVVEMPSSRTELIEYAPFTGLKFEIQIRSVLQHAWAEIEHDLGYKAAQGIPDRSRRAFTRIAGLLEVADAEFVRVRDDLDDYRHEIVELVEAEPANVSLDAESLTEYVLTSATVREVDAKIGPIRGYAPEVVREFVQRDVADLRWVGLETIADVDKALTARQAVIEAFAKIWIEDRYQLFPPGISLFYLCYVMAAESRDVHRVESYLRLANIHLDAEQDVIRTYDAAVAAIERSQGGGVWLESEE